MKWREEVVASLLSPRYASLARWWRGKDSKGLVDVHIHITFLFFCFFFFVSSSSFSPTTVAGFTHVRSMNRIFYSKEFFLFQVKILPFATDTKILSWRNERQRMYGKKSRPCRTYNIKNIRKEETNNFFFQFYFWKRWKNIWIMSSVASFVKTKNVKFYICRQMNRPRSEKGNE